MSKISKIAVIVIMASLLIMAAAGCKEEKKPWESMELNSISVSPVRISVLVNDTSSNITVDAIYSSNYTAGGGSKTVTANLTYLSSNVSIATVTAGGQIRGIAAGSANITVSYTEGNVTKTRNVPVTVR